MQKFFFATNGAGGGGSEGGGGGRGYGARKKRGEDIHAEPRDKRDERTDTRATGSCWDLNEDVV